MGLTTAIEWTDATWQTITAAKRVGVSVQEYIAHKTAGEKWCTTCADWHHTGEFGSDRKRGDGLAASCLMSRRVRQRSLTFRPKRGWTTPARSGDKWQARRRVNYLVEQGVIPKADDLPCIDCGDGVFSEVYPHEYDHARGYSAENQLYVEPVCVLCHRNREAVRHAKAA